MTIHVHQLTSCSIQSAASRPRFALHIDCPVVYGYVSDVCRIVCTQVTYQMDGLSSIVFLPVAKNLGSHYFQCRIFCGPFSQHTASTGMM